MANPKLLEFSNMLSMVEKRGEGGFAAFAYWPLVYLVIAIVLSVYIFSDGLMQMLTDWQREEFSHGFIIPVISLYIFLQRLPYLSSIPFNNRQYIGLILILLGISLYLMGELSSLFSIIQYGFVFVITGIAMAFLGLRGAAIIGIPLAYLLFMIPLPNFLYFNLSSKLQLLSSNLGVMFLRLVNISVFLEGNVIDLGVLRLQVVDACSGLRYLFPLMSFGFLVAYFYNAPLWKKGLVFFSTVPITIFMNSFRIAVIGITVDRWGAVAAEGFLHDFEGWVVFMSCLFLLGLEIVLLERIAGNRGNPLDNLAIHLPKTILTKDFIQEAKKIHLFAVLALALLLLSTPLKLVLSDREETIPPRSELLALPLILGNWIGREGHLEQDVVDALKVNDYLVADYLNPATGTNVNFYIAYYQSQRKGASVHSPKTCMPGGGWEIKQVNQIELKGVASYPGVPLIINRAIIQNTRAKNLVYYWFQQRGRIITNEYLLKWYLFKDAIFRNRTDGSLVRYVVDISNGERQEQIEKELQEFVAKTAPLLPRYIPE